MTLTVENHFICGLKTPEGKPDCKVDFYYDPGGPGKPPPDWNDGVRTALTKVVAITMPLTGFTTFFCCDEHAIEAIKRGQHLPELPPKITGATEADLNRAKAGMKVVDGMKGKPS